MFFRSSPPINHHHHSTTTSTHIHHRRQTTTITSARGSGVPCSHGASPLDPDDQRRLGKEAEPLYAGGPSESNGHLRRAGPRRQYLVAQLTDAPARRRRPHGATASPLVRIRGGAGARRGGPAGREGACPVLPRIRRPDRGGDLQRVRTSASLITCVGSSSPWSSSLSVETEAAEYPRALPCWVSLSPLDHDPPTSAWGSCCTASSGWDRGGRPGGTDPQHDRRGRRLPGGPAPRPRA